MGVLLGEWGEVTPFVKRLTKRVQKKPVLPTLSAVVDSTSPSVSGCRARAKKIIICGVLLKKNVITLREGKRKKKKAGRWRRVHRSTFPALYIDITLNTIYIYMDNPLHINHLGAPRWCPPGGRTRTRVHRVF